MIGYKGNILIDRLMGSQIVLCPCNSDEGGDHKNLELFTEEYTELLRYDNHPSMFNNNYQYFLFYLYSCVYLFILFIVVAFLNTASSSKGANPFVIRLNRIDIVGLWGYIDMFRELIEQVTILHYCMVMVSVSFACWEYREYWKTLMIFLWPLLAVQLLAVWQLLITSQALN